MDILSIEVHPVHEPVREVACPPPVHLQHQHPDVERAGRGRQVQGLDHRVVEVQVAAVYVLKVAG